MPLYVYKCPRCEAVVEVQRKIADMNEPVGCSNGCVVEETQTFVRMERQPTAPSGVFPGAASWRS